MRFRPAARQERARGGCSVEELVETVKHCQTNSSLIISELSVTSGFKAVQKASDPLRRGASQTKLGLIPLKKDPITNKRHAGLRLAGQGQEPAKLVEAFGV